MYLYGSFYQNSTVALSTSGLNIFSGATFGGTGTRQGNLSINDGRLSPGNLGLGTIGTLTVAGNLTFTSNANLDIDIESTSRYDTVVMGGTGRTVTFAGKYNVFAGTEEMRASTFHLTAAIACVTLARVTACACFSSGANSDTRNSSTANSARSKLAWSRTVSVFSRSVLQSGIRGSALLASLRGSTTARSRRI
jgi:hypothetical protein